MQRQKRSPRTEEDIDAIARDLRELEVLDEIKKISRKRGVLLRAALSSSRSPTVILARDAIIDYLRGRFQYSTPEMGNLLRMDHTTVLESLRRTKERKKG